jgi:hypothetical protein
MQAALLFVAIVGGSTALSEVFGRELQRVHAPVSQQP